MLDVSQIMKDLASMVHEQGDTIGKKCACLALVFVLNIVENVVCIANMTWSCFNLMCLINNTCLKTSAGQNKLFNLCHALRLSKFVGKMQNLLGSYNVW